MGFIVGAYAGSLWVNPYQREEELKYFSQISKNEKISCIEFPFFGNFSFSNYSDIEELSKRFHFIITGLPGVMGAIGKNKNFGLASRDREGRKQAIEFVKEMLSSMRRWNDQVKKTAVLGFQIHSAPNRKNADGNLECFLESLAEIVKVNNKEFQIYLEHCDSYLPETNPNPVKGFLSFEDEMLALQSFDSIKMTINWGRSVIETKNVQAPVEQIARLKDRLGLLIFSGTCAANDAQWGEFADSHAPFENLCKHSLMNPENVRNCLSEASKNISSNCVGFKIQPLPKSLTLQERVEFINKSVEFLENYLGSFFAVN